MPYDGSPAPLRPAAGGLPEAQSNERSEWSDSNAGEARARRRNDRRRLGECMHVRPRGEIMHVTRRDRGQPPAVARWTERAVKPVDGRLALPCLALPCLALPCLALPCLALCWT